MPIYPITWARAVRNSGGAELLRRTLRERPGLYDEFRSITNRNGGSDWVPLHLDNACPLPDCVDHMTHQRVFSCSTCSSRSHIINCRACSQCTTCCACVRCTSCNLAVGGSSSACSLCNVCTSCCRCAPCNRRGCGRRVRDGQLCRNCAYCDSCCALTQISFSFVRLEELYQV